MQTIQDLKGRVQDRNRAARAMLAEKGSQPWTIAEQATFDLLLDDAERAQQQISAGDLVQYHSRNVAAEHRGAFEIFLRRGAQQMTAAERTRVNNTMSTTTPSQGGNAVSPFVARELCNLIAGYGFIRKVASRITTSNGSPGNVSTSDGTTETGEQLGENVTATGLDPSFGTVAVNTYKFGSKIFTVPMELLQDSAIDVVQFVLHRAHSRIGRIQNQRFTTGTGTGQPLGLATAAAVGKVGATGQTATVLYDDLVALADSVDEAYLGSPETSEESTGVLPGWMLSQTTRKVVRLIKDTAGRPIWTPAYMDGAIEQPARLLEYPAFINNDMPAPAANAKSIVFGNLRSYLVRDALTVAMYRFDDSAYSSKGQVGFLAVARAGGNLQDPNAVKAYQHSAT